MPGAGNPVLPNGSVLTHEKREEMAFRVGVNRMIGRRVKSACGYQCSVWTNQKSGRLVLDDKQFVPPITQLIGKIFEGGRYAG
jgi:hypothetical protein